MSERLPDWERDVIALQAQRAEQFTAWRQAQVYTDPTGILAEAFEAGWMAGAAHVADPTAEDYDYAAERLRARVSPDLVCTKCGATP